MLKLYVDAQCFTFLVHLSKTQKHVKDHKRFFLVFAIFWIIGLLGGYFLGVGSSFLPTENVEYNYYFSEKAEGSDVEPIKKNCTGKSTDATTNDDGNSFYVILKDAGILNLPHKVMSYILKKS